MKIERIQISSDFLENMGFHNFFDGILHLEMLNNFHYDQNHFFSLERILFKPEVKDWETVLRKSHPIESVELLKKTGNSILCIAKSKSENGFWPTLEQGPWAIIPPISIDPESITLTLIADEKFLPKIYKLMSKISKKMKILAISNIDSTDPIDQKELPRFTSRQREIAKFAVRKGYLESPKKIQASEIAAHFGISVSAINEHVRKVERIALEYFFS
jgi:predicted DNA binding protein